MPPPVLPPLPEGPLSLSAARALGLRDPQWRLGTLQRLTQSVRSLKEADTTFARASAFALALPADVAFSHVTAAQLWRLPLPGDLEARTALDVMRDSHRSRIERRGCVHHRGSEHREITCVNGLRVTSLVDTWMDLAALVPRELTLDDLVVATDVVLNRCGDAAGAHVDLGARVRLQRRVESRGRARGGATVVAALERSRPGSRSPMETRSRLMVVDAGLPVPELNGALHDADGAWLAEGDLVWRRQRVVGEYQGAVHADRRARSLDAYRIGLLGDAGWTVVELFHEDVARRHRRRLVLRRLALALDIDPSTLRLT